jgi:hypothetical protein
MQYEIIGADGKEYGPVDGGKLREWLNLGRADQRTQCRMHGDSEWKNLETFPEFKDCFGVSVTPPPPPPPSGQVTKASQTDPVREWTYEALRDQLLSRNVTFSIGSYFSRGWALAGKRFGLLLGATLLMALIIQVASVAAIVVQGPLMGGVFWIYLMVLRDKETSVSDLFAGFNHSFGKLFLACLFIMLLTLGCMIPGLVVSIPGIFMMIESEGTEGTSVLLAGGGLAFVPAIFISYMTFFAYPIIMEYRIGGWDSVKLSFVVCKRYWLALGVLSFLNGIMVMSGLILCVIGIILTMVWGYGIMIVVYDDLFGNAE